VYSLIPNVDQLERQLERFAKTCAADEVGAAAAARPRAQHGIETSFCRDARL
jgi:hypothetical protein